MLTTAQAFSQALENLKNLYRGVFTGSQRAQLWGDLDRFVSVENISAILEGCIGERSYYPLPVSIVDAVPRLQGQAAFNDWSRVSDGLCALSAFAVNPYTLLTGEKWTAQVGDSKQDAEGKVIIIDWGHGLRLVTSIVESLRVVRGNCDIVDCWMSILANEILAAPWKLHVSAVFYTLRSLQSMGWDARPMLRWLTKQVLTFGRNDFESAAFGALSGIIIVGKENLPAERHEKCCPWVDCLIKLFNEVLTLEEEIRLGALKGMCQCVIQQLQKESWAVIEIVNRFDNCEDVCNGSSNRKSGSRATQLWLLIALLSCVDDPKCITQIGVLLLKILKYIRMDSKLQNLLHELIMCQQSLFSVLMAELTKWIIEGPKHRASTGKKVVIWLMGNAFDGAAAIGQFISRIEPGFTKAALSRCIEFLHDILDTLKRECPPDDPKSSIYDRSLLLKILTSISSLVPNILDSTPAELQAPLCMCVSKISVWYKAYPAALLDTIHRIVKSPGVCGDVLVDVVVGLFMADLCGALPDPGDLHEAKVVSALYKVLGVMDHDCKYLLYDSLAGCLQKIDSLKEDWNPESIKNPGHLWFVYVVRGILMERFQDIVDSMYEKGSSAMWIVKIEKVEKDARLVLGEPVQMLCKALLSMASRGLDMIEADGYGSGKIYCEVSTQGSDDFDKALVSCISCMIHCLCSPKTGYNGLVHGVKGPYQVQIKMMVWAELTLVIQVLIAELVSSDCLNEAVIKELGNGLENLQNWTAIGRVEGLPRLLGGLVFAHQRLWISIGWQYEKWKADFCKGEGVSEVVWADVEEGLLEIVSDSGRTLVAASLRAIVFGDLLPMGQCCPLRCEHVLGLIRVLHGTLFDKALYEHIVFLASLLCTSGDFEEEADWRMVSVLMLSCMAYQHDQPLAIDNKHLPSALHKLNATGLCKEKGVSIKRRTWDIQNIAKSKRSSDCGNVGATETCYICKQDYPKHVNVKWFTAFHMASRYVELLWDLGSHTLTEINAMVKKILTVCDMKLLLHGAMRHIEVEEQDLVWYAHTPCPVAAAVVGIVMDLYHLLTSSSIEMSFSAHVITDTLNLVCQLRAPGVLQVERVLSCKDHAKVPFTVAALLLISLVARNPPSARLTTPISLHILPAALALIDIRRGMGFVSFVLLHYIDPTAGYKWWYNRSFHHKTGPLFHCTPREQLAILEILMDYATAQVDLPVLSSSLAAECPQFGMSLMASAFCVLRISSWVLLVANGNLRKIPCVQYLLESLRKRNLIQTAVVVADYWLTKTPSLPTASGAPRFADQIISLGGLLASESNRFFKDLGVKPVSAAVVKRLHEKHGGCRETKFQKYMGDKPPDWISEAIKMRQQSKAYWSDIDNDMEGSPQQDLNDALSTPPRAKSKGLGWFTSPGGAEGQQSTPRQVNAISWDEIILPDSPLSLAERFDSPERGVTDLEVESTPHQRKKKKKKKRKRVRNPYVMAVLEQEKTAGCKQSKGDTFSDLEDFIVPSKERDYNKIFKKRFFMPDMTNEGDSDMEAP